MNPQIQEKDGKRYVKVRIPVVVDLNGRWCASSDSSLDRNEANDAAIETAEALGLGDIRYLRIVHALVPLPDDDIDILVGEVDTV